MEGHQFTIKLADASYAKILAQFQYEMALETENKKLDVDLVEKTIIKLLTTPQYGFYLVGVVKKPDGTEEVAACNMVTFEFNIYHNTFIYWFQSVYVVPAYRQHGFFKKLFAHVREKALTSGSPYIKLYAVNTNDRAHGVYKRLGMRHTEEREIVEADFYFGKEEHLKHTVENLKLNPEWTGRLSKLEDLSGVASYTSKVTGTKVELKNPSVIRDSIKTIAEKKECGQIFFLKDEKGTVDAWLVTFFEITDWRGGMLTWVYDFFVNDESKTPLETIVQRLFGSYWLSLKADPEAKGVRMIWKKKENADIIKMLISMGFEESENIEFEEQIIKS